MNDANIDRILESLLQIMPLFHKRILRMDLGGVTGNLTRLHLAIMGMLSEGNITVSEMAKTLTMPKSQMSHLIGQLVVLGVVERHQDTNDRRVVNLSVTAHGRVLLDDVKGQVKQHLKSKLATLAPEELDAMAGALETLKMIGANL
jgi:DNA-binding MarR family transcriptional regulator